MALRLSYKGIAAASIFTANMVAYRTYQNGGDAIQVIATGVVGAAILPVGLVGTVIIAPVGLYVAGRKLIGHEEPNNNSQLK